MNERQRRFAAEYIVDLDAKAAAKRAGYGGKHFGRHALRLLQNEEIAVAIAKAEAQRVTARRVTADRIVEELARIAFADMRSFVDWGPDRFKLRDQNKLSEWEAGAIAAVEPAGNGKPGRLKLHDKLAALQALVRHTGLFPATRAIGPTDGRRAAVNTRAVLAERLNRLARDDESQNS